MEACGRRLGEGRSPIPESDDIGLLRALDYAGAVDPGGDGGATFVAEIEGEEDGAAGRGDCVKCCGYVLNPSSAVYGVNKVGQADEEELLSN